MANIQSYFSHDSNARNSDKLINVRMTLGAEGYGVYFMIIERLREEQDYTSIKDYNVIAFDLRVSTSVVKKVVEDFGLFAFTENGERFYSESFLRRMNIKDETSKKLSEAGKKGAEKRWGNKNNSEAIAEPSSNDSKKRKEKKSKVKDSKEKNTDFRDNKNFSEFSEIEKLYNDLGFGTINALLANDLKEIAKDYSFEWIEEAFKIAEKQNVKNIKYVKGILQNWKNKGKDTEKKKGSFFNFQQHEYSKDYMNGIFEDKQKAAFQKILGDEK